MVITMLHIQDNILGPVRALKPSSLELPAADPAILPEEHESSRSWRVRDTGWELPTLHVEPIREINPVSIEPLRTEINKPARTAPVNSRLSLRSGDYLGKFANIKPMSMRPSPYLEDNSGCLTGFSINCPRGSTSPFPPTLPGYYWKPLKEKYSFSAYAIPGEEAYMGDLIDIPGIIGLQAKEEFLFSVAGIAMQGGGIIHRMDDDRVVRPLYIKYIAGSWVLDGKDVYVTDQWYYSDTGEIVPTDQISFIRIGEPRFSILPEPDLIPYYSVAASYRFPIGTKIYVPDLQGYGGIFEVDDRGGAFDQDSLRFDIFVGKNMDRALEWIRLDTARHNLDVYVLAALP